jgi:uncharacterized protein (UPF0276 family)
MPIELTANLSSGLIELIQSNLVQLNAVEVGPWFSVEQIQGFRQQLPGYDFHFHNSNLGTRSMLLPGRKNSLHDYLQCTNSSWLSIHYSLLPPGYVWLAAKFGWYLPTPNLSSMASRFYDRVNKLKQITGLPVLLENMPSFATHKFAFEVDPNQIMEALDQTGSSLLLDIAHARVVASIFGLDVHEYIYRLPLERVVQIHLSGPRHRDGYLYDAHEDLKAEDYSIFEWVLAHTKPEVVTLEYFTDREKLAVQLTRLREIIA